MYEAPTGRQIVFQSRERKACMESRLVLESVGIPAETVHRDGIWLTIVREGDQAMAEAELDAYRRDNSNSPKHDGTATPIFGGARVGALVYSAVLISSDVLSNTLYSRSAWLSIGQMQAGDVVSGQIWRTVTALTLHADAEHLLSNVAFGAVFGLLAGRILGGGVAWLAIVVAGALGNLMNAMARDGNHASIGASTAVFAALGIMVAHALRPRSSIPERAMKRWSPLIGGVLLLSFIGVGGERTDVLAHATGFLAGLLIGWVGCRVPEQLLASATVQMWAGTLAIGIVATAWCLAIMFS